MMENFSETELILNADGSVYHLGLLPEQVSDTIITVGDPERVSKISKHLDWVEYRVHRREFVTHTGWLGRKMVTILSTGMGTDNIDIVMNELDALANIDLETRKLNSNPRKLQIIRIGTSGSLQADIPVDSFLFTDLSIGIDNLSHFYPVEDINPQFSEKLQQHLGIQYKLFSHNCSDLLRKKIAKGMTKGVTVTCPGFYAPQGRSLRIKGNFSNLIPSMTNFEFDGLRLTNFEMETSGYYSLGSLMGHEMISVSAILANRVTQQFSENPDKTVDALIQLVLDKLDK